MRRFFLLGLLTSLLTGCGSSNPPAATNQDPPKSSNATKPPLNAQQSSPSPGNAANPEAKGDAKSRSEEAMALSKQLDQVVAAANAAQSEYDFAKATQLWEQALELLTKLYGSKSWQTMNAKLALENARVQAAFNQSQLAQLKELFEGQTTIASLLKQAKTEAALELAQRSQQTTGELFGADSWMMAKQWVQLARLQQLNGKFNEAIAAYREAILLHDRYLVELHPDKETLHAYLGEAFMSAGQFRPAVDNLSKATLIAQKLWGETSLQYATRGNDLGVAYQRAGENETALTVLRAAETIRRRELGMDHPLVAHSLLNLGTVYMGMNRYELAMQSFEQAIPILQNKFGTENKMVTEAKLRLSAALVLAGNSAAAEQLLEKLCTELANRPGLMADRAVAQYRLAVLQAKQGNYKAAEPNLEAAIAAQSQILGPNHPTTEMSKQAMVKVYEQTGRGSLAESLQGQIRQVNYVEQDTQFKK
jgi:tetratricopeptide (TPR) repeat protein